MKTITFLFFLLPALLCCRQPAKKKSRQSFEGSIRYSIVYTPMNKYGYAMCLLQKQRFGQVMNLYISRTGDLKREYPNSGFRGLQYTVFKADSARHYASWRSDIAKNGDSEYSTDSRVNNLRFIAEKELPAQMINGLQCRCYTVSGADSRNRQVISLTYFYPEGKEFIDPALYKNYQDFFYDKVIAKIKAPYYRLVMDMGSYSMTLTMLKIDPHALPDSVFSIPENPVEDRIIAR